MTRRYRDRATLLDDFADIIWVHCPRCSERAVVSSDRPLWSASARVTCAQCGFTQVSGESGSDWRGPAVGHARIRCDGCRSWIHRRLSTRGGCQAETTVECECGSRMKAAVNWYPLRGGNPHDPRFGLSLWLQRPFRDEVIWAYNPRHLEFLRGWVAARQRSREPGRNQSLASRLPRFLTSGAHREAVLKIFEALAREVNPVVVLLALMLGCAFAWGSDAGARDDAEAADLQAARTLFERNLRAIQERDRDAYLDCYRRGERLVRVGPTGPSLGFDPLRDGTPATGSDDWPDSLVARDLRLNSIAPGLVHGTYRYRVIFDGVPSEGISERFFLEENDRWVIAVTTAFESPHGTPPPALALVGATLHDGRGGEPVENAVVVVRDGRIEAVGPAETTPVPEGVDVVDLAGRFVAPGLIDTHVHYSQTGWADGRPDAVDVRETYPYPETIAACRDHPERFHRAFLHSGVTAVFDVGGYPWTRQLGASAEVSPDAPHVVATAALLSTLEPDVLRLPDSRQFVLMEDEAGVRAAVRSHVAQGSDAIKIWFIVREVELLEEQGKLVAAAGDEARRLGVPLVVHATNLEAARLAVAGGARLLVHSVEDQPVDDAFVAAAASAGVYYCPTLTVRDGYLQLYRRRLSDEVRAQLAAVDPWVRQRLLATESLPPTRRSPRFLAAMEQRAAARRELMYANIRRLHDAGVKIVLGTDAGNPLTLHGPSVFPELEAMEAAGLEPLEVLRAATADAAEAIGRGDDLGVIAAGRIADLIVLEGDPAHGAGSFRTITHVMRAGVLHERGHLAPLPRPSGEKL